MTLETRWFLGEACGEIRLTPQSRFNELSLFEEPKLPTIKINEF